MGYTEGEQSDSRLQLGMYRQLLLCKGRCQCTRANFAVQVNRLEDAIITGKTLTEEESKYLEEP